MSQPYIAEIRVFGFNFAPLGWAFCSGEILPISQNTAVFSLVGTTYGGNGTSNFALPNLQDYVAVGVRTGAGAAELEPWRDARRDHAHASGQRDGPAYALRRSPATASRSPAQTAAPTVEQLSGA